MLSSFEDITSRIDEKPTWFDENGVPRYGEFHPSNSPNIYAEEVMLYRIACQVCPEKFLVEANWDRTKSILDKRVRALSERVKKHEIHFGDPPFHGCAGATMNCLDLRVVQFWSRTNDTFEWVRLPHLEGLPLADADDVDD